LVVVPVSVSFIAGMHFRLTALWHCPKKIQTQHSENGAGAASPAPSKHSSKGLEECDGGQGMAEGQKGRKGVII
jgi:hypothetical protein